MDSDRLAGDQLAAEPTGRVVGLDGCAGGWVASWTDNDANGEPFRCELYPDLDAVFDDHAGADRLLADIPIGLAADDARECDSLARRRLGARGVSVFPAPCRAVVEYRQEAGEAAAYDRANELQRAQLGSGLSKQAWNITPKIAAMDAVLRDRSPAVGVIESHPELCFTALNRGYPIAQPKGDERGRAARFGVLAEWADGWQSCYEGVLDDHYRNAVARDDIIDALVLAVAGRRVLETVPADPPTDERGLPMRIAAPAVEPAWDEYTELATR